MFTITSYNDYFRQCAVQHINIQHNVAAESQDGPVGECTYFIGLDKAITGIRTQSSPDKCTLITLKYEAKGKDNGYFDYRGTYTGAFMVVTAADPSDSDAVEAAEAITEETAWDIINSIIQRQVNTGSGQHCASPFGEVSLNDFSITHVGPFIDKQFGWLVEFEYTVSRSALINPDRLATQFP